MDTKKPDLAIRYTVVRRSGEAVQFDPEKIRVAIAKAFINDANGDPYVLGKLNLSESERMKVDAYTRRVVAKLLEAKPGGSTLQIEEIQDHVEAVLMHAGEHRIASGYVRFREHRQQKRNVHKQRMEDRANAIHVAIDHSKIVPLNDLELPQLLHGFCIDLPYVDPDKIYHLAVRDLFDGISYEAAMRALILAARSQIERDPAYGYLAARLLLVQLCRESVGDIPDSKKALGDYRITFPQFIAAGIDSGLLDPRLGEFDLERLARAIEARRDWQFDYLGLQLLYDRYFLQCKGRRIEMPQAFFMRVAMGLALNELERDARAIEFYHVLSQFDFMCSTPTLFNSGTVRPQLSSCYLSTVSDDLDGIYQSIKENALLQKFAGGIGNDWTAVRALGSHIAGTNGKSQGVIPFLKVANDTALAVNQGGRRLGAVCAYLETWHLDIEEFLDLRKNTGDDRRRTHDMNTANWIPDLFMKRVETDDEWTLFSPSDVPDLHERYGREFEVAYIQYERQVEKGEIQLFKKMPARQLWRRMLAMLFETGHPWITFKDPCNVRSPQRHAGVIHGSNLCTEVTLNTSASEIAVCNLGSINLANHLRADVNTGAVVINYRKLDDTIKTAMRMLDNVIDINFYSVDKARASNATHRPVGLGVMGFHDALHEMRIAMNSDEAVRIADESMERISYSAYSASVDLAAERGSYASFQDSLWDRGILPLDSIRLLDEERGQPVECDRGSRLNWDMLRRRIRKGGMRNSNCIAIAPTATIASIVGVSSSVDPNYQNLYVKSNLSGEFTMVNRRLVSDLKARGLWDEVMLADLKYFNGQLGKIHRIPIELRQLYASAFEIDPVWLVECAARRQKWIDQSQSLNLYFATTSGKKIDDVYRLAWRRGLKTTYYLRAQAATMAEKSTGSGGELMAVPVMADSPPRACQIGNSECEACT